ncbi:zf-HC2 domain-containing protein [Rodentibacter myodis]|uniref:zf-HC2 domain-containing protein n=1 Tax=Rodentibacter myodis TaxID=1907939 RepID=UPI001FC970BF|nr:zf-HC2 domain-containing protein [Rodentibacter myodis]
MMRCKQATQFISLSYEQPLSTYQKIRLKTHLLICPYCRAFGKNTKRLHHLLKDYGQGKGEK